MAEDRKPLTMWGDIARLVPDPPPISPTSSTRDEPMQLHPDALSVAELKQVRHREMLTISNRLGRMSTRRWDRWFTGASILILGGAIGGAFGLIPFFSAEPFPSVAEQTIYLVALVMAVILAAVCGIASAAIKSEREDSVGAIKHDFDEILGRYASALKNTEV